MKFRNLITNPDIASRRKTGIFEDGFRNNLLRESEGETLCGIQVYHLFNAGRRYSVIHMDDLSDHVRGSFYSGFGNLFITTDMSTLFVLRSQNTHYYFRADKLKTFHRLYDSSLSTRMNLETLAKFNENALNHPSYVNAFKRIRINFGARNLSVREFIVRYLVPFAKSIYNELERVQVNKTHEVEPQTIAIHTVEFNHLNNVKDASSAPYTEPVTPEKSDKWMVAESSAHGMFIVLDENNHGRVWDSEDQCKRDMAQMVLTSGRAYVKLLVQERAEISTSIVWS